MKNLYSTYILGFLFVENLVHWLFFINKTHSLTEDIRPIMYLLITVLEGHGRVKVRDLIKYALSRKVVCKNGKRNQPRIVLQENLTFTGRAQCTSVHAHRSEGPVDSFISYNCHLHFYTWCECMITYWQLV